jgi:hypothetical protein
MRKTDSRGNVAVIAITCVALITIAGFGIRHFATEKRDAQPSAVTQSTPKTASTNNNTPADPSEGGKYLVIKEWGVRFKLPSILKGDAYYNYSTDVLEHIALRSKQLDRITATCPSRDFYLYFGISRSKTKYSQDNYPFSIETLGLKQIDGYWYDVFDTGNEAANTYQCPHNTSVSAAKDAYKESISAQTVANSLATLELLPAND